MIGIAKWVHTNIVDALVRAGANVDAEREA